MPKNKEKPVERKPLQAGIFSKALAERARLAKVGRAPQSTHLDRMISVADAKGGEFGECSKCTEKTMLYEGLLCHLCLAKY